MLHIQTILHPTDFSDTADHSLHLARSLARDHGAKLVLLAVSVPAVPISEAYVPVGEMEGEIAAARREVEKLGASIHDVRVECHALQGEPGHAIVSVADQIQADLIVMGTHGRTGLSRILMGSVAEHVMRHAHCPVLTVKPGKEERLPVDEADCVNLIRTESAT